MRHTHVKRGNSSHHNYLHGVVNFVPRAQRWAAVIFATARLILSLESTEFSTSCFKRRMSRAAAKILNAMFPKSRATASISVRQHQFSCGLLRFRLASSPGGHRVTMCPRQVCISSETKTAQVYFPEYGWIYYEFTPGSVDLVRGLLTPEANTDVFAAGAVGSAEEDLDFLQDLSDLERLAREARARNDGEADDEILSVDEPTLSIPWQPFAIVGGMVGLGIIFYGAWLFSVRGLSQRQKSYAKLERLTLLVGMRRRQHETPTEFASRVALWVPRVEDELLSVAIEYQREVYSARFDTEEDDKIAKTLNRYWRTIAWHLIKLRLRSPFKLPQAASGKGITS